MAVYWSDARETHGTGRRYLMPEGELSKGLGGYGGASGFGTPGQRGGDRDSYNSFMGAIHGDTSGSARHSARNHAAPTETVAATPLVEASQAFPEEQQQPPVRSDAVSSTGSRKPSGLQEEAAAIGSGRNDAAEEAPFEVMQPSLAMDPTAA